MLWNQTMLDQLFKKVDHVSKRIEVIEDKITRFETNSRICVTEFEGDILRIREIKNERIYVDDDEIMKALTYKDYRSFLYIFKLYYQVFCAGKVFYPIRITGKRSYEYYYNNTWLNDPFGHYITKTVCNNIQNVFLRFNDISNKKIVGDTWYQNQQFILKLSDEKFKRDMFRHIIEEIKTSK